MLKRISRAISVLAALTILAASSNSLAQSKLTAKASSFQPQPVAGSPAESDRIRDGLVGPVRRVRTEVVKLANSDGRIVEGKRALLEVVAYDIKGNKTENQYFPITGETLTGKEVYKYNDKGNISEMTLLTSDGSLLSRETYKYEFDFAGNWNKMITSVAIIDAGKISFEPTEVTYRSIMYYLDENMVKMVQPAAPPAVSVPAPTPSNSVVKLNSDPNAQPVGALLSNKSESTHKSPEVPTASAGTADLNGMNSAELKNVSINPEANAQSMAIGSEPPPNPVPRPILKPVSGGVLNGIAISLPAPAYPDTARRMRTSGTVAVAVVIDENGKVISAQAMSGPPALREAAVQAAMKARFSPTKLSGQPVKVAGSIDYKFTLAN
jgi:TonB family protein